ncbi:unnamed protein product [Brassicogethes aeneus]|uniref:Thioredoxin domain-containing protein n=1 Tax=Brassicogethes aeneus TaxID=1431903 RepID=A0A9P0FA48_BRAAE|nr:unnamed protein product [Brassicogethes aeneus]
MAFGKVTLLTIFVVFCAFFSVNGQKRVVELNEDNWTDILKNEWMVEFYAPWCPACKALQKTWADFAGLAPGLGIKVGQVDVTTSQGLSGRFMITALPTIFHVLNGEIRQYKGSRDKDSFTSFVEDKKWQQVEPTPGWRAPDSIQMTVVSGFFKLSQYLRQVHTKLMEDFGLPTWGSYLIFALATIVMGALIGMVLVCVIDLIYPPKRSVELKVINNKKKAKDSGDEMGDEDIGDDLLDDAQNSQTEGEENNTASDSELKNKDESAKNKVKKRKARRVDM